MKYWILFIINILPLTAFSAIGLEPYAGVGFGIWQENRNSTTFAANMTGDIKLTEYGIRCFWWRGGLMLGLQYAYSQENWTYNEVSSESWDNTWASEIDLKGQNLFLNIGHSSEKSRFSYVFSYTPSYSLKLQSSIDDNVKINSYSGTQMRFEIGYKVKPKIRLSFNYLKTTLTDFDYTASLNGVSIRDTQDVKYLFLVSVPFRVWGR